jgi:hypothetical protein
VFEGYVARARQWEIQMAMAEDGADLAYYRFWDRFRASAVLGTLVSQRKTRTLEDVAFDLAYCYLELLQGIAARVVTLDEADSFLTTDFAVKLTRSVRALVRNMPGGDDSMLARLAQATFERLGVPWSP